MYRVLNDLDVQRFARGFVREMVETSIEMSKEEDYSIPTGDITEDIREQALQYAEDMLVDFQYEVLRAIREMKFNAERTITINFEDC